MSKVNLRNFKDIETKADELLDNGKRHLYTAVCEFNEVKNFTNDPELLSLAKSLEEKTKALIKGIEITINFKN